MSRKKRPEKEKYKVPKKVQDIIPIDCIWGDGITRSGRTFSQSFSFSDINYATASDSDKLHMFMQYCDVLNAMDVGATYKLTVNNRRVDKHGLLDAISIPMNDDGLDEYRDEYNRMLADRAEYSDGIQRERYLTISIDKPNVKEGRAYINRAFGDISKYMDALGSNIKPLDANQRLSILRDFFRQGEESDGIDMNRLMRYGHSFKDTVAPDGASFAHSGHFTYGNRFGCVLFLRDYANYLKDSFVLELCEASNDMMLTMDIIPVHLEDAIKEVERLVTGVEANIVNWQRRQTRNMNFASTVPYHMEKQRDESKEFLDDLISRDQRMMLASMTIVHTADSLEQLNQDTESIHAVARKHLCRLSPLTYMQREGLNTALPYGLRQTDTLRTLTTESTGIFLPYKNVEFNEYTGQYYGRNKVSKNMIFVDRDKLLNGNSFVISVSGGGKSFLIKRLSTALALSTQDEIIFIDPEAENAALVNALGGAVVRIGDSNNHVNPFDMNERYGDNENPLLLKSDLLLSLCDQAMGDETLSAVDKSIIDRCCRNICKEYIESNFSVLPPTLVDFHRELLNQPEKEAGALALAMELYTDGTLNAFAHRTNVDINNRFLCYDTSSLGKNLQTVGMLIILDNILARVTANRGTGKRIWVFVDEIHMLFKNPYASAVLAELWVRIRKNGGICTGALQTLEQCKSDTARNMINNSEFLVMLNQSPDDRKQLKSMLSLSETQMKYITNVPAGHGLLRIGGSFVPFEDEFPKGRLYDLMTTRRNEGLF